MERLTRALTMGMAVWVLLVGHAVAATAQKQQRITEGALQAIGDDGRPLGNCPLKDTDVKADIAGFLARVTVTQEFENPFKDKIEAVYVFPLGATAAVDDMTMKVGDRVIRGLIKPREEARRIYEQAKSAGHVASLLDQERPNIFTQAVANIEPGKSVTITISYVELLKYADGVYNFAFPMVVGPRYIPGAPTGKKGTGWAPDTGKVPDASKITPPVTPEGTRAGHDISISVTVDAGLEIKKLDSRQHKIVTSWKDQQHAKVRVELASEKVIPNKDFVLEYSTVTDEITDTLLTCVDRRGGFFAMILQPPKKVQPKDIRPRELVFVIDSSGSMRGFPIDTAKAVMRRCVKELRPNDTFNLITFAGHTSRLWEESVPNTEKNRERALEFLKNLQGAGGTEMMKAINAALGGERDPERVRLVCFMTDGYVGNDMAIIDAIQKNVGTTRVFSFGIGSSVNRYLLDNMARAGRGEVEYVYSQDGASAAAGRFYDRINSPVLTDISLDWGALGTAAGIEETYPQHIMDLFDAKPVVITGRYTPTDKDQTGTIVLRGNTGAGKFERKITVALRGSQAGTIVVGTFPKITVALPALQQGNSAMPSVWARSKIEHLMNQNLANAQVGKPDPGIKEKIVGLGMNFRLVTQYTSFVAVEEKVVTIGGQPRTVAVPVEMPSGVSYEGVFGEQRERGLGSRRSMSLTAPASSVGRAPPIMPGWFDKMSGDKVPGHRIQEEEIERIREDTKLSENEKKLKIAELKLAAELQHLETKLDKDGNYSKGRVTVRTGKIDVVVYLTDMSEKTLDALKKMGFAKMLDSPAVKMVLGTIDVSKLIDLAQLDEVRRIEPPIVLK